MAAFLLGSAVTLETVYLPDGFWRIHAAVDGGVGNDLFQERGVNLFYGIGAVLSVSEEAELEGFSGNFGRRITGVSGRGGVGAL